MNDMTYIDEYGEATARLDGILEIDQENMTIKGDIISRLAYFEELQRQGRIRIAPPRKEGTGFVVWDGQVKEVDWWINPFEMPMMLAKDHSFQWNCLPENIYKTVEDAKEAQALKVSGK